MGTYRIERVSDNNFRLYENEELLASFSRATFRERLEAAAADRNRSSNWRIGSILRIFLKQYPPSAILKERSKTDTLRLIGEVKLLEYLRSKGFRVHKGLPIDDSEIIRFMESLGYQVEGMVGDDFSSTEVAKCSTR